MNIENKSDFIIDKKEFGALFQSVQVTEIFPFGYEKSQGIGLPIAESLMYNTQLQEWVLFISNADKCTEIIHGGGGTKIEHIYVFTHKSENKALLVEKMTDQISITEIADKEALAPTFAYAYGTYVKEQKALWQLSELSIESYVLLLHLIDIYKRMNCRSLLAYKVLESYKISITDVMTHYKESLEAKDARWLLPTCVFFTEVFAKFNLEVTEEKIQNLVEHGFISIEKATNGKDILIFKDPLIQIAKEYEQYFINASRFSFKYLEDNVAKESGVIFVTHTRKGNHLAWMSCANGMNIARLQSVELIRLVEILRIFL